MKFWKATVSVVRVLALGVALFSCVSCVSHPQIPSTFWKDKNAKVAVVLGIQENRGHFTQISNNVVVSERNWRFPSMAKADAAMGTVKPDAFRPVRTRFAKELRKQGFGNVVEVNKEINWRHLPHHGGIRAGWMAGADFSGFAASQNADYIIILSLEGYGAARNYFGVIPKGAAWGSSVATGAMVDRKGTLLWASGPMNGVGNVEGEWDQPPGYPNLKKAAHESLKQTADMLFGEFFQQWE